MPFVSRFECQPSLALAAVVVVIVVGIGCCIGGCHRPWHWQLCTRFEQRSVGSGQVVATLDGCCRCPPRSQHLLS